MGVWFIAQSICVEKTRDCCKEHAFCVGARVRRTVRLHLRHEEYCILGDFRTPEVNHVAYLASGYLWLFLVLHVSECGMPHECGGNTMRNWKSVAIGFIVS